MAKLNCDKSCVLTGVVVVTAGVALFVVELMSPPTGYIEVVYKGESQTGVWVELKNSSTQSIYLIGAGDQIRLGYAVTQCRSPDDSRVANDRNVLSDGYASSIKVSPGKQVRLNVTTALPKEYRGGHCRVRLEVMGGLYIESREFTPD